MMMMMRTTRASEQCLSPETEPAGAPDQRCTVALERYRSLHFIGIGGVGMSAIARLCRLRGFTVSGSDLKDNSLSEQLRRLGVRVSVGHAAAHVDGCEAVVVSSAIHPDNAELAAAIDRGLPVFRRAEVLGWLMRDHFGIAIAGAHGKTTTTSMTSDLLAAGGLDPTLLVGGEVLSLGSNVREGASDYVVVEADESDGSFLVLPARVVIVTNIDDDHLDYYGTMDAMEATYLRFINGVGPGGLAILCVDDERVRALLPRVTVPRLLYGFRPDADVRAVNVVHDGGKSTYQVVHRDRVLDPIRLNVPGRHNVQNSLAAIAVAGHLGVAPGAIRTGLASFSGVKRRFQYIGEARGIKVFDDYAHHPTEIRATLASARLSRPRRLVAIFQPHRFSRTELLASSFAQAFSDADVVLLLPIYGAGEHERDGVSSDSIFARMVAQHPYVISLAPVADQAGYLPLITSQLEAGDWVFTVGAGDVNRMGGLLLAHLEDAKEAAGR
jgi:UDP-N-acetylmuramate--alanine ligase